MIPQLVLSTDPLRGLSAVSDCFRDKHRLNFSSAVRREVFCRQMVGLGLGTFLVENDPLLVGVLERIADSGATRPFVVSPYLEQYSRDIQGGRSVDAARSLVASLRPKQMIGFAWRGWPAGLRALRGDFVGKALTLVHYDLARLRHLRPSVVLLHPTLTDLAVAFRLVSLVDGFRRVALSWGLAPGLMTSNLAMTLEVLAAMNVEMALVAGPVNRQGYQMRPDRATCERAIREASLAIMATQISDTIPPTREDLAYLMELGIHTFLVELGSAVDMLRLLDQVEKIFRDGSTADLQDDESDRHHRLDSNRRGA